LLARIVFAESEGNPFLIEEVFRHLAEERELFDANP
jgi:predicted ATPase